MKTYYTVYSNPMPGKDAEFNDWYNDVHLAEVLQIDGFVSAQRFQLAETQVIDDQPYRYLAMYEIESDAIEQTVQNMMAAAGGLQMSDAMDTSKVHIAIVQSVTDVVTRTT
jgi:hypothetical protein